MNTDKSFISLLISIFLAGVLSGCTSAEYKSESKLPPYARSAPIQTPEIFGPEVISTKSAEFATTFSPDGETVYFNQWIGLNEDDPILRIVRSRYLNGEWSPPEAVSFSDGSHRDIDPFLTHDGKRLYFSSNRPVDEADQENDYNTWYVEQTDTGWSAPVNPGAPLNEDLSEVFVSVTKTGTIYFSARDGARHIYRAEEINGVYQQPEKVTLGLPDSISIGNPMIAADESFLIISTQMLGGEGSSDLFWCPRDENGIWGEIKNLGPRINSAYREFAPSISPDGQYLFFTSERPGLAEAVESGRPPGDIYQISLSAILK